MNFRCLCFSRGFPVSQGSIISSIGYGINAVISAIAAVIETIVGAIVAVRTVLLPIPSEPHPNAVTGTCGDFRRYL